MFTATTSVGKLPAHVILLVEASLVSVIHSRLLRLLKFASNEFHESAVSPLPIATSNVPGEIQVLQIVAYAIERTATVAKKTIPD